MTCKECLSEMKVQFTSEKVTIWVCPFRHHYTQHGNKSSYPYTLERKS